MKRLATLSVVFALAAAPCAFAATINVPGDQPTIQSGINAALKGDVVLVAPGTYVENINFMGKAITVKSSAGPAKTIIDGNAAAPVVVFLTNESVHSVLSGFTLQNGVGTFPFQYEGGGIFIYYASPTITKNIIRNNNAPYGGGVGVSFGSPVISYNTVTINSATFGGGISIGGASNAQVVHNTISKNTAAIGAGLQLFAAANGTVANNKIVSNVASSEGGGIDIVNESDEIIVQNLIALNRAPSGSQIYSGVPQSARGFQLISNTIVSFPTGGADAAVIADGFNMNVVIENNVINAAGDNAAIVCNPVYKYGPPIVQFNDAFNGTLAYGGSCAGFAGTNGNISSDPALVNVAKGNYQLAVGSPAINAGSNSAPVVLKKDYAGHTRIVAVTIDMGAYEVQ